jgi:hypothetical protein
MTPPVVDRFGRPIAGQQPPDPITGVLYPCYFSIIPAIVSQDNLRSPKEVADEAMGIALAACAKIGITIAVKNQEEKP